MHRSKPTVQNLISWKCHREEGLKLFRQFKENTMRLFSGNALWDISSITNFCYHGLYLHVFKQLKNMHHEQSQLKASFPWFCAIRRVIGLVFLRARLSAPSTNSRGGKGRKKPLLLTLAFTGSHADTLGSHICQHPLIFFFSVKQVEVPLTQ